MHATFTMLSPAQRPKTGLPDRGTPALRHAMAVIIMWLESTEWMKLGGKAVRCRVFITGSSSLFSTTTSLCGCMGGRFCEEICVCTLSWEVARGI